MVKKYGLVEVMVEILENTKLQDRVHQSALALLGHLCTHSFDTVYQVTLFFKTKQISFNNQFEAEAEV